MVARPWPGYVCLRQHAGAQPCRFESKRVEGLADPVRRSSTSEGGRRNPPVCTENLIRVDAVMEPPSWRNDRAVPFRSGRPGLAIQGEVAA